MKNEKEFRESCAAYVLGALEKEEQEKFERFLQQTDEEHLEILREYRDTAIQLPLAVRQQPPNYLRRQTLDAVHRRSKSGKQKRDPDQSRLERIHRGLGLHKPAAALATLAALLLLAFGLLIYSFLLHEQHGAQQNTVAELQDELGVMEDYLSILESRQLEYVRLEGNEQVTGAFGKLICNPEQKQALLQMSNFPAPADDKTYELWLIKNGQAVNKGKVESGVNRLRNFFLFEEFEMDDNSGTEDILFTITLESEPGKAEPSGETIMSGSPVIL